MLERTLLENLTFTGQFEINTNCKFVDVSIRIHLRPSYRLLTAIVMQNINIFKAAGCKGARGFCKRLRLFTRFL